MHAPAALRRERGFSLVELAIVIMVLGIVAAAAAPLIGSAFLAYFTGRDIAETDWQARVAIERMSRELRTIAAPADLTITAANDITFVDVDRNTIRYCMGAVGTCPGIAGDLMRNGQPLAGGVSALAFSFLTRAAAPTAVAAQVFYVTVDFTATRNGIAKAYQLTVSPRNFP